MSLTDLTRNAFQSGVTARKWLGLCRLFISRSLPHTSNHTVETELSNSVLLLFRDYPGDPVLQGYLKHAIQDGILRLPTFLATFLGAAQSPELHNAATLDMLARVALDVHYASGLPAIGSIVAYGESTPMILNSVQHALALLRIALALPISHFHQLITSASELLILLVSCVPDVSQIPTAQAMVHFADANDLLQNPRLTQGVRQMLESFAFSLSLLLGDDAKVAREAQMLHTFQLSMGKSDIFGHNSDTDVVTCGLLFHQLLFSRAVAFGCGDGPHVNAILVALLRWSSWSPPTFYSQLLISGMTCMVQSIGSNGPTQATAIWRAFVIGRLPHLMAGVQKSAQIEGISESDWHTAMQYALPAIHHRNDLLEKCDPHMAGSSSDSASDKSVMSHSFLTELVYQLLSVGLIEPAFAASMHPTLSNDFHPRVLMDAQESGLEIQPYYEAKLCAEATPEDIDVLIHRTWKDPCSHAAFAHAAFKRFTSAAKSLDADTLSTLCRMFCQHEVALDIFSLHERIVDLVAHALAFVEDYDCETVGDPQTGVTHLGEVVLFAEAAISRFNLASRTFNVGDRQLKYDFLQSAGYARRADELKDEDRSAIIAWSKAIFDTGSEGIEDTILRATKPKVLLGIAATLVNHAISLCMERKMEKEALTNGISYFLSPLLNWTLAGVNKFLLADIQRRGYNAPVHLEVLRTLLQSPSCPRVVLALSAAQVLRLFPLSIQSRLGQQINIKALRIAALDALGLPAEGPSNALTMNGAGTHWSEQPRQMVANALAAARAGRAPALDVEHCLILTSPTKFLTVLWSELVLSATLGDVEPARRLATFVLTTPRTPRTPPLLPLFLHLVLPSIVAGAEALTPSEQTITTELLVAVLSSTLTAALHVEWALVATCDEERFVLGQSVTAMARRLSGDLRRRGGGQIANMVLQRLTASQPFVANFPTFAAEL